MYKEEINRVKSHLNSLWYNVAFISLYGSQNYELDTPESDLDYKAVHIPSLSELVNNSKPVSKTLEFEWWQIDLKDVRIFTENLCKMNPVYIETLYSPHSKCYNELFKEIIKKADSLMKEMRWLFVKGCHWQVLQKYHAFSHPYPSIKDKVDRYWYDPKQLHHIMRLTYLAEQEITEAGWIKFIYWENRIDFLKKIKTNPLPLAEAEVLKEWYYSRMKRVFESTPEDMTFDAKNEVVRISKGIIYNEIILSVKENNI